MEDLAGDREVLGRLADRVRAVSENALVRSRDELDGRSVATAVHELCEWAAQQRGITEPVPVLHPLASGDQLAVIGREFLDGLPKSADPGELSRWRKELALIRRVA